MNALNKISTLLLKVCEERIIFYPEYFNRVDLKYQVYGCKEKSANYLKSFTALWLGLFSKGHHQTGHVLCVAIQLRDHPFKTSANFHDF